MSTSTSRGPGTANRTWLFVVGLFLFLAGATGLILGLGLANPLLEAVRAPATAPDPGAAVSLPESLTTSAAVIALAAGAVLLVLSLLWLARQAPRRTPVKPFRLHDSPAKGTTVVDQGVLADTVSEEVADLPGVVRSSLRLRGSAREPDMLLDLTVNEESDVQHILDVLQRGVAHDLATSLGGRIATLRVHLEASSAVRSADALTVQSGG